MGVQANYLMVTDEELDSIAELEIPQIVDKIEEFEEEGKHEIFSLFKMWDTIHCYLTNESASNPIDENKLSESIVGIHFFKNYKEGDFYITGMENSELKEIILELEKVNFKYLKDNFDFNIFKRNQTYPEGIWLENREKLIKEIEDLCTKLTKFYRKAFIMKMNIIISIY